MRRAPPPGLAGNLNIVLRGLRLRGLNGPEGLMRMGGWARGRHSRMVADHIRTALSQAGDRALLRIQDAPKRLRITVVHKGVFDEDNLRSSVKPLLDSLKPRAIRIGPTVLATDPGLILDDDPGHLSHEVFQERGAPEVRIEAWGRGMGALFAGRTIVI